MRRLSRPIAMFVVLVLAVIAVGVGVVAATTSQSVNGPSWGHFSAGFSFRVHIKQMTWLDRFPIWQVRTNPSGWLVLPLSDLAQQRGVGDCNWRRPLESARLVT